MTALAGCLSILVASKQLKPQKKTWPTYMIKLNQCDHLIQVENNLLGDVLEYIYYT